VAEALVAGVRVIATRTKVNSDRLAGGAAGVMVPFNDPNELAHAIVTTLFKPEKDAARVEYATASRDRFRPEHRATALKRLYSGVIG
jgi:glycosyltransferase involved in cell wall biosynthesis